MALVGYIAASAVGVGPCLLQEARAEHAQRELSPSGEQAGLFGVSSAPPLRASEDTTDTTARGGSILNRRNRLKSTPALKLKSPSSACPQLNGAKERAE